MPWLESAGRDVRHAWRMIARMPGIALVVVLSLGVGIGVNVVIFSWMQAVVFQPIPGVADAASFHLVEPRSETGMNPGTSWQEYQDLRARLRTFRDLLAFRMTSLYVGEPGQVERAYGLAGLGQLLRRARAATRVGPLLPSRGSDQAGRRSGRGHLARVLAVTLCRRPDGHRPVHPRQQPPPHDCRRRPTRIPGHGSPPQVRPVAAGDDGAGALERIAGARAARQPRLHGHGPAHARDVARAGTE